MFEYIGYIRVSTVKQGTQGVSLQEQRSGIIRYADQRRYQVGLWLDERETAAKQGRPMFNQAVKLLRQKKYKGIILHKLDRGARNLEDWVEIGKLADQGIEVHFVNESLDLQSRGGRLAADIQAVVATDYIRNLREETRKGFYGRLKQGLYPLQAPLGYKDEGKGKPKTIDPVKGPLIKRAFELYSTAEHSLESLENEMYRLGLRNRNGGRVGRTGFSTILNNPFYIGLIHLWKTDERFDGIHEPLIKKSLYDRVQLVLQGKLSSQGQRHAFMFRRYLSCATCNYSLVGELQKGHVYYRCHSKQCSATSLREDFVEAAVSDFVQRIRLNDDETAYLRERVLKLREHWADRRNEEINSVNLRLGQIKERLNRLTDAFLDQTIEKSMFEERKAILLSDQKSLQENLSNLTSGTVGDRTILEKFLEPLGNAWLSYSMALPAEKREIVQILTSNSEVRQKELCLKPQIPFGEIAKRSEMPSCGLQRDIPRTWEPLLERLIALQEAGQLPDLSQVFSCRRRDQDTKDEDETKGLRLAA